MSLTFPPFAAVEAIRNKTFQLEPSDFSEEKRYPLGPDRGWWNPNALGSLPTAQVMFDNGMVLNLAYQDIEENRVTVFLVIHGT